MSFVMEYVHPVVHHEPTEQFIEHLTQKLLPEFQDKIIAMSDCWLFDDYEPDLVLAKSECVARLKSPGWLRESSFKLQASPYNQQ